MTNGGLSAVNYFPFYKNGEDHFIFDLESPLGFCRKWMTGAPGMLPGHLCVCVAGEESVGLTAICSILFFVVI